MGAVNSSGEIGERSVAFGGPSPPPGTALMNPRAIGTRDDREALFLEQALAFFRELDRSAGQAGHGKILAVAEQAAVAGGRELTRAALESVLNRAAAEEEKKTPPAPAVPARPVTKARRRGRS